MSVEEHPLLEAAWEMLRTRWTASRMPPSHEVFADSVERANRTQYVSAKTVAERILAGAWPE